MYGTFRRMLAYRANGLPLTQDVFILTFTGSLWLVCLVMALALLAASFRLASLQTAKLLSGQAKPWTWVEITLWAVAATCQQGRAGCRPLCHPLLSLDTLFHKWWSCDFIITVKQYNCEDMLVPKLVYTSFIHTSSFATSLYAWMSTSNWSRSAKRISMKFHTGKFSL